MADETRRPDETPAVPDAYEPLTAPDPAAPPPRGLKKPVLWGIGALAALLIAVIALLPRVLSPSADVTDETGAGGAGAAADARRIQATLYYISEAGTDLVPVVREVPYGETPAEQARLILDAQVQTPEGQISAIPAGTKVRGLFLGGKGDAYVDLSPEASTAHRGGTLDEALAVYALVNALTTNLPDVTAVQILIDGKEVDTLAGHVDLREPLQRSNAWIRKGP